MRGPSRSDLKIAAIHLAAFAAMYHPLCGHAADANANDAAKLQAVYDAAPNNSVIDVPIGRWPLVNGAPFSPRTAVPGKSVLWNMLGAVDAGLTGPPGNHPVSTVGDNDLTESFSGGHLNFVRTIKTGNPGNPAVFVGTDNYSHAYVADPTFHLYPGVPAFQVNVHSHPGSNGTLSGVDVNLFSGGSNPYSSEDQGVAVNVTKYGQNSTWAISTQTVDNTGLPPAAFATVEAEMDIVANGPDDPSSLYDPAKGHRSMLLLVAKPNPVPAHAANHRYERGMLTWAMSSGGVKSVYIATIGGTTGAAPPPQWPAHGTVTDGSVTWTYGEAYNPSVGLGIFLGHQSDVVYNNGFSTDAAFGNAVIDLSKALLANAASAGIRLGHNMALDFSADGTAAGQNQHDLVYSDAASGLVYKIAGRPALSVGNDFALTSAGHEISTGAAPTVSNGTLNVTATDRKGTVTEGAASTGTVITFHAAYASPPDCVVTSPTGTALIAYTPTATTLTIANAATSNGKFTYHCVQ